MRVLVLLNNEPLLLTDAGGVNRLGSAVGTPPEGGEECVDDPVPDEVLLLLPLLLWLILLVVNAVCTPTGAPPIPATPGDAQLLSCRGSCCVPDAAAGGACVTTDDGDDDEDATPYGAWRGRGPPDSVAVVKGESVDGAGTVDGCVDAGQDDTGTPVEYGACTLPGMVAPLVLPVYAVSAGLLTVLAELCDARPYCPVPGAVGRVGGDANAMADEGGVNEAATPYGCIWGPAATAKGLFACTLAPVLVLALLLNITAGGSATDAPPVHCWYGSCDMIYSDQTRSHWQGFVDCCISCSDRRSL